MSYPALPGHAIPYHIDGTVVKAMNDWGYAEITLTSEQMSELNDEDYTEVSWNTLSRVHGYLIFFFPEQRELQGLFAQARHGGAVIVPVLIEGSNDSTNGLDGTWETASSSGGYNSNEQAVDTWRKGVKVHGFSGPKRVVRIKFTSNDYWGGFYICHLYGTKGTGQTPDDVVFLDAENSDAQFTAPLDYGDRPAGTSVVRQIKLQNTSEDYTANQIDIQLNHADWTMSLSPSGPWGALLEISSLGPGVKSSIIYIKNTTEEPPADLGPKRVPIIVTVDSWS